MESARNMGDAWSDGRTVWGWGEQESARDVWERVGSTFGAALAKRLRIRHMNNLFLRLCSKLCRAPPLLGHRLKLVQQFCHICHHLSRVPSCSTALSEPPSRSMPAALHPPLHPPFEL